MVSFLLESLVFILIGLLLRGVIDRIGGTGQALTEFAPAVAVAAGTVVLSSFLWIFGIDGLQALWRRFSQRRPTPLDWRGTRLKSWTGMRGVVTLAVALTLPSS